VVTNTSVVPNLVSKFIYDGDGTRVLQIQISGTQVMTTAYAGAIEVANGVNESATNLEWHSRAEGVSVLVRLSGSMSVDDVPGDGSRVMQVQISGTQIITTAYAGAIEVQITATQRITKAYYSVGSQLVAMRVYTSPTNSVLYFLHSDHLGSTSLTTDSSGGVVARQLLRSAPEAQRSGV
jgi:hypothetical protein